MGLMSLMTFWIVYECFEEAMFKIWLKSVEFEGNKNPIINNIATVVAGVDDDYGQS